MNTVICSYCKKGGHYINNCKDPNIEILHKNIQKDAIIHIYCSLKHNFNFLLYKFNLLTIPEMRVLIYWNDFDYKLTNKPNKKTIQDYIDFLIHYYTFHCKNYIYIPYIDNNSLWDYATDINRLTNKNTVLSIYTDMVQISPRPCWFNINIKLTCNQIIPDKNNNNDCSICLDSMFNYGICTMNCKHNFCSNCIKQYLCSLYVSTDGYHNIPICPLCRTNIISILMNDYFSYNYFKFTFFKEFKPDYFNYGSSDIKRHVYERPYYYLNHYIDDEEIQSPYHNPIYIPTSFFIVNETRQFIRNHMVLISRFIRIIKRWFIFICMIYFTNLLKKQIEKIYDEIYEIDDKEL